MYLEDVPIKKQCDDLLHRRDFAIKMGKSLIETSAKDGFCVGVYGPWGSGKTSVINMILEEIENIEVDEELKPIVLTFNPWNFSTSDQLIQQFFLLLSDRFSSMKNTKLSKIGAEIKKYSDMLDVFGDYGKALKVGGSFLGNILARGTVRGTADISKQKELVINLLSEQKRKVIIVIDDIDRLGNEEIRLIFQLVNAVAKFPNTIYLLAFDQEIVARALTEVQNYDGFRYLEKIIQVPIHIPEVSNDSLWEALFKRLDDIYVEGSFYFEAGYWQRVFNYCVTKYIKNIRDVIRLSNTLSFKCNMIGDNANYVDLIALTIIEIKEPYLYKWIKDHRDVLVGSNDSALRNYNRNLSAIIEENKTSMEAYGISQVNEKIDLLKMLFPYFEASILGNRYYSSESIRREMRIGHGEMFDRYFVLELGENAVNRTEFDYAINQMSKEELSNYIDYINNNNCTIVFLKELGAAKKDIPKDRIEMIVSVLINKAYELKGTDNRMLFSVSAQQMLEFRIKELLLEEMAEEDRFCIIKKCLLNGNDESVSFMASFLNTIELSHGRLAAQGQERGDKLISIDHLIECEKLFVDRIKALEDEKCLMDLPNAYGVLYLYECFSPDEYKEYIQKLLTQELNIVKYGIQQIGKWTSGNEVTWRLNKWSTTYLTEKKLVDTIAKCIENDSIWTLNEESIHRAVAYLVLYRHKEEYSDGISDKEISERINKMKNK